MIALKQAQSSLSLGALCAPIGAPMVKSPDFEPEAAREIQMEQAARLTRLRTRLGLDQIQAAEMALVDRDSWGRAERGASKVNPIALARFVEAVHRASGTRITAEFVITGRLAGLDDDLARELLEIEAAEQQNAREGKPLPPARSPRGRKRRANRVGIPT